MSEQKRWPKSNSKEELEYKIGENFWWLIILAKRSNLDIKKTIVDFLEKTENKIK